MTSKDELRVSDYLEHIVEAIDRIQRYTKDMTETVFLRDEKTQDAVVRNIEIIGEASKNIIDADPQFATRHPDIPWSMMYRMRNAVSHGYFAVDHEVVWRTLHADLPDLDKRIRELKSAP